MSFETDLATAIGAYAGVSALVGTRIYHYDLRQDSALPALVFKRVSTGFTHSHSGRNPIRLARVQFDCWATDEAQLLQLAEAVIESLQTFNLADSATVPVSFPNFVINQFPLNDREADPPLYRQIVEARIWFQE